MPSPHESEGLDEVGVGGEAGGWGGAAGKGCGGCTQKLLEETSESETQIQVAQEPNERPRRRRRRRRRSPRVLELVGRRQMPSVKLGSQ